MRKILLLCETHRDKRELYRLANGKYEIINGGGEGADEHLDSFKPLEFIEKTVERFGDAGIEGVIATDDYPGCIVASAVAERFGLPAPATEKILLCQHKYYSRMEQKKSVPEAVPEFELIDPESEGIPKLSFPFFVKPVKSFFSVLAQKVWNEVELGRCREKAKEHVKNFVGPFNQLLSKYGDFELSADYLIGEELLKGKQVTVEGFAFGRNVEIIGVVDSVMFPGTICFKRFEYPSKLPEDVRKKMEGIARKVMNGIGFEDGIFNIEMIYDPAEDNIYIVEINPRMASQFADLVEKVDGANTYEIQAAIALGEKPAFERGMGRYKKAGSFVLRRFEDGVVKKIPGRKEVLEALNYFPDARIEVFGTPGKRLSEELQDGKSFRYGLINLGGDSDQELINKYKKCKEILKFEFE